MEIATKRNYSKSRSYQGGAEARDSWRKQMHEYKRREYTVEDRNQNTQTTREKPKEAEEERKEELTVAIAGE